MRQGIQQIDPLWIATLHEHVRPDFLYGQLYWVQPGRGKIMSRPVGCTDSNGYRKVRINFVNTYVHQVMFYFAYGYWPTGIIDHDDRNPGNNVPTNLIDSDYSRNMMNSGVSSRNASGVRGVSWIVAEQRYKVTKQGKHLGYFDHLPDAAAAYERG